MATARPTQAFIQAKLEAILADTTAAEGAREFAEKMLEREDVGGTAATLAAIRDRVVAYLSQSAVSLTPRRTRRALAWLVRQRHRLTEPQRAAVRARLLALEAGAAPVAVRRIVNRIVETYADIGHDDATIWGRLNTALGKTGEDVDPDRIQRLLIRWRNAIKDTT